MLPSWMLVQRDVCCELRSATLSQTLDNSANETLRASVLHDFDWDAILQEHDRWLRTIVYARLGEPQAVDARGSARRS